MSNSFPKWFDEEYYATQKINQMNIIHYKGKSNWDKAGYDSELASFDVTAFENFEACNTKNYADYININDINVSPNKYFDVSVYLQNCADWANGSGSYSYGGISSGKWTAQNMLIHIFKDLHISAWEHFKEYGMKNGLNPSNEFDTNSYLNSRAIAMNNYINEDGSYGWEGKTDWTQAKVLAYLEDKGINVVEDYFEIGNPILKITVQTPAESTIVSAPDNWTPWGTAGSESNPGTANPPSTDTPSGGSGSSPSTKPNPTPDPDPTPNPDPNPDPDPTPDPDWAHVHLTLTQLKYSNGTGANNQAIPTTFYAIAGAGAESTLRDGVQISGDKNFSIDGNLWNGLYVNINGDFSGLGENGFIENVPNIFLNNISGKTTKFNAENIHDLILLTILNNSMTVENLENAEFGLSLLNMQEENPIIELNFSENALASGNKHISLTASEHNSNNTTLVAKGIEELTLFTEGQVNLNINGMPDLKELYICENSSVNLGETVFKSNGDAWIQVDSSCALFGDLNWKNADSLGVISNGSLGSENETLTLKVSGSMYITNGDLGNKDIWDDSDWGVETNTFITKGNNIAEHSSSSNSNSIINVKVIADGGFTSNGIYGESIKLDLSDVKLPITSEDQGSLIINATKDITLTTGNGSSNISATASTANLTGGSGDDIFHVFVSQHADVIGNGGNDEFFAYTNNGSEESTEFTDITFTGKNNATCSEKFFINTHDTNTKLALTINGYDANDSIEIIDTTVNSDSNIDNYLKFADVASDDAIKFLKLFNIDSLDGLIPIENDNGIFGYYDNQGIGYGFAPTTTGELVACVKVSGLASIEAAAEAFGIANA